MVRETDAFDLDCFDTLQVQERRLQHLHLGDRPQPTRRAETSETDAHDTIIGSVNDLQSATVAREGP